MERQLAGPWARLVRGRERMLERVGARSAADRDWRPDATGWSLAEVVEHMVLAEGGLGSALAKEPTPERPRVVAPGRWLRWPLLRIVLKAGIRIRAPVDAILPKRDLPWDLLVARWESQRSALGAWLETSDPRIHPDPRFRHPIVGWLTVPQALTFAADHLDHHLQQVGRIERALRRQGG